jgi:hypothetical protein
MFQNSSFSESLSGDTKEAAFLWPRLASHSIVNNTAKRLVVVRFSFTAPPAVTARRRSGHTRGNEASILDFAEWRQEAK